jgi:hypothetical protein
VATFAERIAYFRQQDHVKVKISLLQAMEADRVARG